jgi:Uri superfamily endonuclease
VAWSLRSAKSAKPAVGELPRIPGVYALLLLLRGPATVRVRGRAWRLEPGCYVYVGSARGPGGLRARVARHAASEKRVRWHVDQLTSGAAELACVVYAEAAARECVLVPHLERLGFGHPVPGFGSSDCGNCRSHLLRCPRGCGGCAELVEEAFRRAGLEPRPLQLEA